MERIKMLIFLFVFFLPGCGQEKESDDPAFQILGSWRAVEWHCTNVDKCVIYYVDKDADLVFDIESIDETGRLTLSEAVAHLPSCEARPFCHSGKLIADSAVFTEDLYYDHLYIRWGKDSPEDRDYLAFDGIRQKNEDKFTGMVEYGCVYEGGDCSYIWNDEVEIIKIR